MVQKVIGPSRTWRAPWPSVQAEPDLARWCALARCGDVRSAEGLRCSCRWDGTRSDIGAPATAANGSDAIARFHRVMVNFRQMAELKFYLKVCARLQRLRRGQHLLGVTVHLHLGPYL